MGSNTAAVCSYFFCQITYLKKVAERKVCKSFARRGRKDVWKRARKAGREMLDETIAEMDVFKAKI